jgi:hypothetical protein
MPFLLLFVLRAGSVAQALQVAPQLRILIDQPLDFKVFGLQKLWWS